MRTSIAAAAAAKEKQGGRKPQKLKKARNIHIFCVWGFHIKLSVFAFNFSSAISYLFADKPFLSFFFGGWRIEMKMNFLRCHIENLITHFIALHHRTDENFISFSHYMHSQGLS